MVLFPFFYLEIELGERRVQTCGMTMRSACFTAEWAVISDTDNLPIFNHFWTIFVIGDHGI